MASAGQLAGCGDSKQRRTFRENLPFTGLASRRIGQNVIQLIKEILHFTPSFPFRHLVTDPEFGRAAVISATRRQRISMVHALQARDAAVLHRMMVRAWNV